MQFIISNAQNKVADLMKIKPIGIKTLKYEKDSHILYIQMPFNEATIMYPKQVENLPNSDEIYSICLVYTRFKESDSFSQPLLNKKRYENLFKLAPQLVNNKSILWQVLEQREAKERDPAAKCFHGFVVYKKIKPPSIYVEREIGAIKKIISTYKDSVVTVPEKNTYKIRKRRMETGYYIPTSKKKKNANIRFRSSGFGTREKEYHIIRDTISRKKTGGYTFNKGIFTGMDKTMEYDALTNRVWSKNMAVAADVTGSMSPYSLQVLLWLKNKPDIIQHSKFLFFNDGDGTPDIFKKIGSTGGLHLCTQPNFDSVASTMFDAMLAGSGGDYPENNVEAILQLEKTFPEIDTILLIADAQAPIKDLVLKDKITKPLIILLCGNISIVCKDYFDLIKKTGGKIIFLKKELNAMNLKDGEIIEFENKIYKFIGGTLKEMSSGSAGGR